MAIENIFLVIVWIGLLIPKNDCNYHNDGMTITVFCRENCDGYIKPDACEMACPQTPWVSLKDVRLELSCSTEAAVLTYDLSKLLEKNFKDLTIHLSQEKEEEEYIEAGNNSVISYNDTQISERIQVNVESFGSYTFSDAGLCSDQSYTYCLHVTHGQMTEVDTKLFCQVSYQGIWWMT